MNDEHEEDYVAAYEGGVGADRMAMGLPCIPDKLRGDMDEVKRLRMLLEANNSYQKKATIDIMLTELESLKARVAVLETGKDHVNDPFAPDDYL